MSIAQMKDFVEEFVDVMERTSNGASGFAQHTRMPLCVRYTLWKCDAPYRKGCACIGTPLCKARTVYIWRASRGGLDTPEQA